MTTQRDTPATQREAPGTDREAPGTDRMARTPRGARTRAKLLEAAEQVFATVGYHEASIVKITEEAGVALGTFYTHFVGKKEIFDEVVLDLSQRVRHAMSAASSGSADRIEAERAGFRAFFEFTAQHPALYRIIRQAEFVSPEVMRRHYDNIVDGYAAGLADARTRGEIRDLDPVVTAWALMGAGELIGMRWVLWEDADQIPEEVFEGLMEVIRASLAPQDGRSLPTTTHGVGATAPTMEGTAE